MATGTLTKKLSEDQKWQLRHSAHSQRTPKIARVALALILLRKYTA